MNAHGVLFIHTKRFDVIRQLHLYRRNLNTGEKVWVCTHRAQTNYSLLHQRLAKLTAANEAGRKKLDVGRIIEKKTTFFTNCIICSIVSWSAPNCSLRKCFWYFRFPQKKKIPWKHESAPLLPNFCSDTWEFAKLRLNWLILFILFEEGDINLKF